MTVQGRRVQRSMAVMAVVMVGVALLLPLDFEEGARLVSAVLDVLHFPLLAAVSWVVVAVFIDPGKRSPGVLLVVACGVAAMGVLLEVLQPLWGREGSLVDVLTGSAGSFAGVLTWYMTSTDPGRLRRICGLGMVGLVLVASAPLVTVAVDSIRAARAFPLLASFESALELGRWEMNGVEVDRAREHAVHGRRSAKVTVSEPAEYPGLFLVVGPRDWSGTVAWCVDVYWPEDARADLWLRLDDRKGHPSYGDRFQKRLVLAPGPNRIRVDRSELAKTPGGRDLDLANVVRCGLFLAGARKGDEFFFDNMTLILEGP